GGIVRHQKRIAVGRGFGDDLRAEDAVRPGLVLDDELLAPALRELLPDKARDGVGKPARRITDDHAHRLVRIVPGSLPGSGAREGEPGKSQQPDPSAKLRMHGRSSSWKARILLCA